MKCSWLRYDQWKINWNPSLWILLVKELPVLLFLNKTTLWLLQNPDDLTVYIDRGKSKKSGAPQHPPKKKQNYGGHDFSSDSESDGDERFTNIKHTESDTNKDRKAEGLTTGINCPTTDKEASPLTEGTGISCFPTVAFLKNFYETNRSYTCRLLSKVTNLKDEYWLKEVLLVKETWM